MNIEKINLEEKFSLFSDQWSPKIIGQLNGQDVKLAKVEGEFVWHDHANEDELFYVVKGSLRLQFRDKYITLNQGEMCVVPRGVEHKPVAKEETWLMLFEPSSIKHTGEVRDEKTVDKYQRI
ncbi:cupin domain-containing protein [Gangjinia marincola]|uniref:Cupin domain-containing protein n=1 Tax=Gangjinia marincola TaxID=578463 RepID=A0ABN1MHH4_9FLAO